MWQLDRTGAPPSWRDITETRAVLAFSTRLGGVSAPPFDTLNLGRSTDDRPDAVTENRRRLLAGIGLDPEVLATAGQLHAGDVREPVAPRPLPRPDAVVRREPGPGVAGTTRTCRHRPLRRPRA